MQSTKIQKLQMKEENEKEKSVTPAERNPCFLHLEFFPPEITWDPLPILSLRREGLP
jgi:hypothetical protein